MSWDTLTPGEIQVLTLLGRGLTNKEIAAGLFLAESTVKARLYESFKKLGVTNRTQAVLVAIDRGLITPSFVS